MNTACTPRHQPSTHDPTVDTLHVTLRCNACESCRRRDVQLVCVFTYRRMHGCVHIAPYSKSCQRKVGIGMTTMPIVVLCPLRSGHANVDNVYVTSRVHCNRMMCSRWMSRANAHVYVVCVCVCCVLCVLCVVCRCLCPCQCLCLCLRMRLCL
jgi:hypothetical protein